MKAPVRLERCRADADKRPARVGDVAASISLRERDADRRRGEEALAAGPPHAGRYPSEPIVLIRPWPRRIRPAVSGAGSWRNSSSSGSPRSSSAPNRPRCARAGPDRGRDVETDRRANRVGKPAISPRAACIKGLFCASPCVGERPGHDRDHHFRAGLAAMRPAPSPDTVVSPSARSWWRSVASSQRR